MHHFPPAVKVISVGQTVSSSIQLAEVKTTRFPQNSVASGKNIVRVWVGGWVWTGSHGSRPDQW